jgi:CelD/BcsL family acetyltransferase involved in cellulose biosynthesis
LRDEQLDTSALEQMADWMRRVGARRVCWRTRQAIDSQPSEARLLVAVDESYVTLVRPLPSEASELLASIPSKTRNQVRKGLRFVTSVHVGSHALVDALHTVLSRSWRDLGTPPHGRAFFANILDVFGDDARVLVVEAGGEPAAAALILRLGDTLFHPYAATREPWRRASVGNALYWHLCLHGIEAGCTRFDLGRSRRDQGTYAYKVSWGATPVPLRYVWLGSEREVPTPPEQSWMRFATAAWKYLPVTVSGRLGPAFIRYVP